MKNLYTWRSSVTLKLYWREWLFEDIWRIWLLSQLSDWTPIVFFYEALDGQKNLSNVSTLYNVVSPFLLLLEMIYIGFKENDCCESVFARWINFSSFVCTSFVWWACLTRLHWMLSYSLCNLSNNWIKLSFLESVPWFDLPTCA